MRLPASTREQRFRQPERLTRPDGTPRAFPPGEVVRIERIDAAGAVKTYRVPGVGHDRLWQAEGASNYRARMLTARREAHLEQPTHYHVERLLGATVTQHRVDVRKADADSMAERYAYSGHSNAGAGNGAGVDDGTPRIRVRGCHFSHALVRKTIHGRTREVLECTGKR
jgi:hypothetical protein